MPSQPPPAVLDSARVMSYASVHDIPHRNWGALMVGGVELGKVPLLAIGVNLGEDAEALLLHCDDEWNVVGVTDGDTIDALKERAEQNYPGVASRWVDLNTSVEDALCYYDAKSGEEKCSFCGRRPFEVEMLVQGSGARIYDVCVEKFQGILRSDHADG